MRTELKVQAVIALLLALVTGGALLFLINFKDHESPKKEEEKIDWRMNEGETYSVLSFLRGKEEAGSHDLLMKLPAETDTSGITCDNDPEGQVFSFSIPGIRDSYFRDFFIAGSRERLSDISFEYNEKRSTIKLFFSDITEVLYTTDGNFLCFDYMAPQEYYDRVVVLDAGEGGRETGAVAFGSLEKDINLSIAKKLKEEFSDDIASKKTGIYCTRKSDVYKSSEERVDLAKKLDADLLLSIHCSSTASGRTSDFSGTRVLYSVTDETGSSKAFAGLCLSNLVEELSSKDRGIVAGDEDYLVREATMPVALCEIGYMTNENEHSKLIDDEYQRKAAHALYEAVIGMLSEEAHEE